MRRSLIVLATLLSLLSPSAQAANSTVSAMTAASALGGTELLYIVQAAADRKATPAQIAAYVYGLASGDCTISGVGAIVCTKTNGTNFGSLATTVPGTGVATFLATPSSANLLAALTTKTGTGNAVFGTAPTIDSLNATTAMTLAFLTGSTQCLQVNTSGVVSGTGAVCGGAGSSGANPTATAGPTAVNGVATTFLRSDGAPAVQLGTAAQKGIVQVDGTSIVAASGVISAAPLAVVTSIQSGTNYPFVTGDQAKVVYLSNASNQIPTVPVAGSAGFAAGWFVSACNIAAGTQTITPATGTIGGAATYVLAAGTASAPKCVTFISDGTGTNYAIYVDGAPLNGANIWTQLQTFSAVVGAVSTQSGTTYTFASTDCGTTVRFSNASAVTATIPQGLPVGCNIAVLQAAAGQVSVNGSAVTPATLQSAHSYTKTFGAGAMIGLTNDASNHIILTGDGA